MLLEERDGSRWLADLDRHRRGAVDRDRRSKSLASPRPNSHDLARSVIDGLHGELERVVVTDLRDGTYYATLTLRSGGRRVEIDARPSDAIAIALRTGAPIFVRDHLFERARARRRRAEPRSVDLIGRRSATSARRLANPRAKRSRAARLVRDFRASGVVH